jgi:hypothetical protein
MRPQTIRRPRSATLHEIEPVNKLFFQKGYDVVKQIDRTIMLRAGERIGPFNAYPGFGGQPRLNPARDGVAWHCITNPGGPAAFMPSGSPSAALARPTIQTCDLCLRRASHKTSVVIASLQRSDRPELTADRQQHVNSK